MQRTKNIRLLISLCVLSVVTCVLWIFVSKKSDTVIDKNIFRVADLKTINKIVLEKSGENVTLTFDGGRWKVNGHLADRSMIDVLFATFQQAEPKRSLSGPIGDSINTVLEKEGVHVSLFRDEDVQLEFLAGGNASKTQAYFKKIADDDPYVVIIPGYRVYTAGILELGETGWKDKYVFNFNWRNFQSLKASFPDKPENNFEVSMGKSYFEIKGIQNVDTTKLNDFLDAVSLLTVDEYLNPAMLREVDSLITTQPRFEILVTDISGKTYALSLHLAADQQQLEGVFNKIHPALLDARKVAPLVKTRSWFVKKVS